MTDIEAIAKGLSGGQKEVFRESSEHGAWFRDNRSVRGFMRKGLVHGTTHGSNAPWTPLGRQLYEYLQRTKT